MSGQSSEVSVPKNQPYLSSGVMPTVMIVDDEPVNVRVLADALRGDYELVIATDATKALDILAGGDIPHLILLDIMMPGIDGLEMCRRLKSQHHLRHIPVIFVTALSDIETEEKGFEAGAVDYIYKPIRMPAVRARIRTHISLRGMLDHMAGLNQTLREQLGKLDQLNWQLKGQKKKLQMAEASNSLLERIYKASSEGIAVLSAEGLITSVNASFTRITGYQESEILGQDYTFLNGYIAGSKQRESIFKHLHGHDYWSGELYNRRKNGELYPELRTISAIRANDGKITQYVTVFNDITNLRQTEQRLEELTWRDPVTGLPNRTLFLDQLSTVLKFCHHGSVSTAVIVIDINNFRYINETYGFESGDWVIREFANRLKDSILSDDSIARLSGDEFGIVLASKRWSLDEAYREVLKLCDRIQNNLIKPVAANDGSGFQLVTTVGAALYPTDSCHSPSIALQHAETAHRSAKASNRTLAIFEDSMSEAIREQLRVETELNQAIENEELVMFAQPQLTPDLNHSGVEVLVRWEHPTRGLVGPGDFIPHAEKSRQIVKMERYIIQKSLALMCQHSRPESKLRCSINISAMHFSEDDFVPVIINVVQASGWPPELVTFELTESVMVQNVDLVIQKMEEIRKIGCSFSLDDFGTGYSSLSQLRRLPISEIKIDRSFIIDALEEKMSASIVEMVYRIGETMNVRVVAEGVETDEHARFLSSKYPKVHLQGYAFGRPKPLVSVLGH